jgi:phosphatidylglycerophosphate synthase
MANALTAVRLLLVIPIGILTAIDSGRTPLLAAIVIVIAIVTDLLDGRVARWSGTASSFGGLFDHTTDCLFVVSSMVGGAVRGVVPWLLPALVAAAFIQYVVDSYLLHRQRVLRGSQLGRYNGILYFVPVCGDTLIRLGLDFLTWALAAVCWLLVLTTCISIGQRLFAVRQRQTAPASPVEETAGQSRH